MALKRTSTVQPLKGLKETGWVAQALANHHIKGVAVAPPGYPKND